MDFISGGFPKGNWLSLGFTIGDPIEEISKRIYKGKTLVIDEELAKEIAKFFEFIIEHTMEELGKDVGGKLIEYGIDKITDFLDTQYIQWKQSSQFRKAVFSSEEVWPRTLRSLTNNDYDVIIKSVFAQRIPPPQVMEDTWTTINQHSGDIKKLVYSRLVSRNEIEKIASNDFNNVVNNANEVCVYLANFDCLNATTSAEVLQQRNNEFVGSFVDYNFELKKQTTPDEKSLEERYIGDTLAVYGNMLILSSLMENENYKNKLKIYLCKGTKGLEKPYHTFRGTLIETNDHGKIGFAMLMPEKAPGTVSTKLKLDVLDLYEKAEHEIEDMQPQIIRNINSDVSNYAEQLEKLVKEYNKFDQNKKNKIMEKLVEIKQSEKDSKIIVKRTRELQHLAIT